MQNLLSIIIPIVFIVALTSFLVWINLDHTYRCTKCGNIFGLSLWEAALAPHVMEGRLVKCPKCGNRAWVTPVRKRR